MGQSLPTVIAIIVIMQKDLQVCTTLANQGAE